MGGRVSGRGKDVGVGWMERKREKVHEKCVDQGEWEI